MLLARHGRVLPDESAGPQRFAHLAPFYTRVHRDNALVWFKKTVAITILKVMPVIAKPTNLGPPFGGKSVILFLPKKGREVVAQRHDQLDVGERASGGRAVPKTALGQTETPDDG